MIPEHITWGSPRYRNDAAMKTYPCYIPSYRRAGRCTSHLPEILPPMLEPIFVVHESDYKKYLKAYPDILVVPTPALGIGATRAWICKEAIAAGNRHDVAAMLDDDITGWYYKPNAAIFGGVQQATRKERDRRWQKQLERAEQRPDFVKNGYAVSFTWRTALAFVKTPVEGIKLGLVNECMLMNRVAMERAQFTLATCEDMESTIHWLLNGTLCGQDPYLGHKAPQTAHTAERGGCGVYREAHPGYHLKNHRKLWKMFPEVVAKPIDTGKLRHGMQQQLKTRVSYQKAAQLGGLL